MPTDAAAAAAGGGFAPIIMMVIIFVVFYFMLIRPQKKKEKQLKEMIANLKKGDEVVTIGGIHGKIERIKDDIFVLETGVGVNKSYVSMERGSISRLVKAAGTVSEEDVQPLAEDSTETIDE